MEESKISHSIKLFFLGFFLMLGFISFSQEKKMLKEGKITYTTSSNVYVAFNSTAGIETGDTLFIIQENAQKPVLIVSNLSSISCVCKPIGSEKLEVGDKLFARNKIKAKTEVDEAEKVIPVPIVTEPATEITETEIIQDETPEFEQDVYGRVSVSSYSNFNNGNNDFNQRMRYVLSMNTKHINDSRLSFESYISFQHTNRNWDEIQGNIYNGLKIYNLALNYSMNNDMELWFGRKINPKISSIGAIDGIQFEKGIRSVKIGAFAGSRPDWNDYSFNIDLFQAGVYFSHEFARENLNMQNSIAIVDQENKWNTDRRFIYLQHSDRLFRKLYFFGSGEVELYKKVNGKAQTTFDLSNLYLMLKYQMFKQFSLSFSYSARNNIIYYETYKNFIQRLIDLETLQGYSVSFRYRPAKRISIGARGSYRSRPSDIKASRSVYAYFSYSNIPGLGISPTLSATILETSYINGKIYGLRLTKDLIKGKIFASVAYRRVSYTYYGSELKQDQNNIELNLDFRVLKTLFFSAYYENTFYDELRFNRLYFNLTKRF